MTFTVMRSAHAQKGLADESQAQGLGYPVYFEAFSSDTLIH